MPEDVGTSDTVATSSGSVAEPRIIRPPGEAAKAGDPDYPTLTVVDPQHYVMGDKIAEGGMGQIVAARDRRLGRAVAIKSLRVDDPELAARFEREARITARLQHPAIVQIHEAGTWPNGEPFYAMKLVEGRSLDDAIALAKTLEERLALVANVVTVAEAIAFAHARRVIHRDIKPRNVVVGAFGETVVIDWGLAKDLTTSDDVSIEPRRRANQPVDLGATVEGDVLGTPAYMPVEQAHGEQVDERADVYSIGALLYHVLAGRPPYVARNATEVLAALLSDPPRRLAEIESRLPPDLVAIVERAMAREARDRYPSAQELAADLRRFTTGQLVGAHQYSTWQLIRRWVRRNRGVVLASVIALVALVAFATYSIRKIVVAEQETAYQSQLTAQREEHLAVEQARALIDSDPTMALVSLRKLAPSSELWPELRSLVVDATLRGVAKRVIANDRQATQRLIVARDGRVFRGGVDGSILVLSPAGARLAVLRGHVGNVLDLVVAPDGRVLSLGVDGTARLWEASLGTHRILVPATEGAVALGGFTASGAAIMLARAGLVACPATTARCTTLIPKVTTPARGTISAGEIDGRDTVQRSIETWTDRTTIAASPVAELAIACESDRITLWDVATATERWMWRGRVTGCGFAPDGQIAHINSGALRSFEPTAKPADQKRALRAEPPAPIVFSADGKRLLSFEQGLVRVFDRTEGLIATARPKLEPARRLAISPDGRHFAWTSADGVGSFHLTDEEARDDRQPILELREAAREVAFAPDGTMVTSFTDGSLRTWGEPAQKPFRRNTLVHGFDASRDGETLMVRLDSRLHVLAWRTGATIAERSSPRCTSGFSPDGKWLGFCDEGFWKIGSDTTSPLSEPAQWTASSKLLSHTWFGRELAVIDPATPDRPARTIPLPPPISPLTDGLASVRAATDADIATVLTNDHRLFVVDLATGALLQTVEHTPCPSDTSTALTGDGMRFACATGRTIWTVARDGTVVELRGHVEAVSSLAVLSDGTLVSIAADRTMRIWNLDGTSRVFGVAERSIPVAGPHRSLVTIGEGAHVWDVDAGKSFVLAGARRARTIGDGHTIVVASPGQLAIVVDTAPRDPRELARYVRAQTELVE